LSPVLPWSWALTVLAEHGAAVVETASPAAVSTAPEVELWHWALFGVAVAVLLAIDLFVLNREAHEPSLQESAALTAIWAAIALGFNVLLYFWLGSDAASAFLTGYVVEWSLSMDNVFVFFVVFTFFGVPLKYQHRVLFWGIIGAVAMRLTFVAGASALLHYMEWIILVFGAFLVYTGVRLAMVESEVDPEENWLLQFARRTFPVAEGSHGENFFVQQDGRWHVTPLFLVLLVIESTDLLFAVDSVPTILGVVQDWLPRGTSVFTFIAFTSNVFAILGLRALYFLLARSVGMFRYLNVGLSAVLVFIGIKMMVDYGYATWIHPVAEGEPHPKLIYPWVSLVVIFGLLGGSIAASIWANYYYPQSEEEHDDKHGHGKSKGDVADPQEPALVAEGRPAD
jgi:tellurite resistance protein TerC